MALIKMSHNPTLSVKAKKRRRKRERERERKREGGIHSRNMFTVNAFAVKARVL